LYKKVFYNDEKNDYNNYDTSNLANKFVKLIVAKKTDPFLFDRFVDRIQNEDIHELKIAETFEEFTGDNVDDKSVSVEDTTDLLDSYVEAVETDLDKGRIKNLMRTLYVEAQATELV
jgi:LPS O-antigen subunit length determinant protein (WzzB/FepE family)